MIGVVMIGMMISVMMKNVMIGMMIGAVMTGVVVIVHPLHVLMLHVRFARYMDILLVSAGGEIRMILMMMTAMIRLFMLLCMRLIQTGILTLEPQIIS
jgi:hypothetical protein